MKKLELNWQSDDTDWAESSFWIENYEGNKFSTPLTKHTYDAIRITKWEHVHSEKNSPSSDVNPRLE